MKYSVNLILWLHNANEAGLYPIYLKVTINRQTTYLATGKFIPEAFWNKKDQRVKDTYPSHSEINSEISNKKASAIKLIVKNQVQDKEITAKEFKRMFSAGRELNNIFEFTDSYIKEVQNKRADGTLENYRKHLLKLELFNGSRNLFFEDITSEYLSNYERWIMREIPDKKTIDPSYTYQLMKTLRTMFNAAIKRKIISNYPFDTYEMPEFTSKDKEHLSLDELKALEKFCFSSKKSWDVQTSLYFLLGSYTGLRISDLLQFNINKHYKGHKLNLRAKKNKSWIFIPVGKTLKKILEKVKATPFTMTEQNFNDHIKTIMKHLKINKHMTAHCARHTFAVTICLDRGVSSETAAELMGITLKTFVESYSEVTETKIISETSKAWKGL